MNSVRIATYNIHKGVQGMGPRRRLEIHNLRLAVEQFDADIVCLQEVRAMNRREEQHFARWPEVGQADFLAPHGYQAVYVSNAITRHGEHGNALLSRWPVLAHQQHDISDHRFEQRGLLHVEILLHHQSVHVVVVHLGLIPVSRAHQMTQLRCFIEREVPAAAPLLVAGDFNEWGSLVERSLSDLDILAFESRKHRTFPSRLPLVQLDNVFARGLRPLGVQVPRGRNWWRMSDHLPLLAEFALPKLKP